LHQYVTAHLQNAIRGRSIGVTIPGTVTRAVAASGTPSGVPLRVSRRPGWSPFPRGLPSPSAPQRTVPRRRSARCACASAIASPSLPSSAGFSRAPAKLLSRSQQPQQLEIRTIRLIWTKARSRRLRELLPSPAVRAQPGLPAEQVAPVLGRNRKGSAGRVCDICSRVRGRAAVSARNHAGFCCRANGLDAFWRSRTCGAAVSADDENRRRRCKGGGVFCTGANAISYLNRKHPCGDNPYELIVEREPFCLR
jgi:hypothetical protein